MDRVPIRPSSGSRSVAAIVRRREAAPAHGLELLPEQRSSGAHLVAGQSPGGVYGTLATARARHRERARHNAASGWLAALRATGLVVARWIAPARDGEQRV